MFRWLLAVFIILLLVNAVTPWFKKIGFGRLPGDLNFTLFGREFNLPFTTTLILSLVAAGIARIFQVKACPQALTWKTSREFRDCVARRRGFGDQRT